ncbi:MAG TPA: BRCT domain-containing protein, partial [Methylomirabilota bacterium]|nr:BRCT domain-containing protein [Methylomirabilota bacterium]
HGIGSEIARSVARFFADAHNRKVIERLRKAGVVMREEEAEGPKPLAGKTIVLTGTLARMTRDQAKDLILRLGGRVSGSVSKKTDFVVVGEEPGSKLDDAKRLGVKTLDEEAFLTLAGRP